MGKTFKILSIDGGGIRGIIPGLVLTEIEARTSKPIASLFDLIAGTSTGGVLALGLTMPGADGQPAFTARDGVEMYAQEGARIFSRSMWHRVRSLGSLIDEKYPTGPVDGVFKQYFGNARLRDALTDVLITSYETQGRFPWFFRSQRARNRPDYDFPLTQVARATTAAPTYFEPLSLETGGAIQQYCLIDGGVYANNPAMCAYIDALTFYQDYDDILVVSLGTGQHKRTIQYREAKDWGLVEWVRPVIDVLMDGGSATVAYQMQTILKAGADGLPRYYRFQTALTMGNDDMDDISQTNLHALADLARQLINDNTLALDMLCDQLLA